MQPYLHLLQEWLVNGTLSDDIYSEFFVMQQSTAQASNAREHWQKAYVVRSVNLSELLGNGGNDQIDVAVPSFLSARVKDILSIGKTVELVRYLDYTMHTR